MRVSGIDEYLKGADNVQALSIIQGEKRQFEGTITDSNGDPIDITNFVIEQGTEFFTATAEVTSRSASISSLTKITPANSRSVSTTKDTDPSTGKFTVTIPQDLYEDSVDADIEEDVPIAIAYIRLADGDVDDSDTTARIFRMVIIIRRSTFTS